MIKRYPKTLTLLAVMAVAVVIGLMQLPSPMGTDLSRVGQGQPSVVLAFENYSPRGSEALTRLNAVREEYEDQMVFVLADLGTPQGQAFANRHGLRDGQTMMLAADGTAVSKGSVPADAQVLRARLEGLLTGAAVGG